MKSKFDGSQPEGTRLSLGLGSGLPTTKSTLGVPKLLCGWKSKYKTNAKVKTTSEGLFTIIQPEARDWKEKIFGQWMGLSE